MRFVSNAHNGVVHTIIYRMRTEILTSELDLRVCMCVCVLHFMVEFGE